LLLIAAGLYLFLILVTYHRSDPGWSHSATEAVTRNAGGAFGAWLSDLMLYLFGLSAYWWVALCLYLVVWGWRRMDGFRLGAALGGFLVFLLSSAALERLRLHSLAAELPLAPGGLAGDVASTLLSGAFGFTGATLALAVRSDGDVLERHAPVPRGAARLLDARSPAGDAQICASFTTIAKV